MSKPRRTSLSTAPKATRVVASCASGITECFSAISASFTSDRDNQSGTPSGITATMKRASDASGMACARCSSSHSLIPLCWVLNRLSGIARRGPRTTPPSRDLPAVCTSESPPRPDVRIRAASTIVCQPPTCAPSLLSRGAPPRNSAISVVVPPISATSAVFSSARNAAPARLAAGPDKIVSTGREREKSACSNEPSPLTTINGQDRREVIITCSVAVISRSSRLISRAFSRAVKARRGPPRLDDNS